MYLCNLGPFLKPNLTSCPFVTKISFAILLAKLARRCYIISISETTLHRNSAKRFFLVGLSALFHSSNVPVIDSLHGNSGRCLMSDHEAIINYRALFTADAFSRSDISLHCAYVINHYVRHHTVCIKVILNLTTCIIR